jgi:uncharacterized protein (DUF2147 family)
MRATAALLAGFVLLGTHPNLASAQPEAFSPVGLWRTFDDHTGKERGAVRISDQNGILFGSIVSTVDPAEGKRICEKCPGDRKNQPIIGLNIIRGLRQNGEQWSGGEILDPETGSIYRCSMRVEDGGRKLVLRGYFGISLLGRSQTWLRAN